MPTLITSGARFAWPLEPRGLYIGSIWYGTGGIVISGVFFFLLASVSIYQWRDNVRQVKLTLVETSLDQTNLGRPYFRMFNRRGLAIWLWLLMSIVVSASMASNPKAEAMILIGMAAYFVLMQLVGPFGVIQSVASLDSDGDESQWFKGKLYFGTRLARFMDCTMATVLNVVINVCFLTLMGMSIAKILLAEYDYSIGFLTHENCYYWITTLQWTTVIMTLSVALSGMLLHKLDRRYLMIEFFRESRAEFLTSIIFQSVFSIVQQPYEQQLNGSAPRMGGINFANIVSVLEDSNIQAYLCMRQNYITRMNKSSCSDLHPNTTIELEPESSSDSPGHDGPAPIKFRVVGPKIPLMSEEFDVSPHLMKFVDDADIDSYTKISYSAKSAFAYRLLHIVNLGIWLSQLNLISRYLVLWLSTGCISAKYKLGLLCFYPVAIVLSFYSAVETITYLNHFIASWVATFSIAALLTSFGKMHFYPAYHINTPVSILETCSQALYGILILSSITLLYMRSLSVGSEMVHTSLNNRFIIEDERLGLLVNNQALWELVPEYLPTPRSTGRSVGFLHHNAIKTPGGKLVRLPASAENATFTPPQEEVEI